MIRAALLGMSTVVGVGAVLSYQPAAEVAGAAVAPLAEQPAGSAPTTAAPTPTAVAPSSTPEAGPGTTAAAPSPGGTSSRPKASGSPASSAGPRVTTVPGPAETTRPASSPSPVASTPRSTPQPSASSSPTRTATPTPTPTDDGPRTWTGAAAVTPYGNVQVALVVDGGVIVDAYALQFPSEHPTSREIASYALPELRRQTLQAQSAAIAGVSGASYDTAGWITSLQSALSKAAL